MRAIVPDMGIQHYATSVDPRYLEFVKAEPRRMWNLPPAVDSACLAMAWVMGWKPQVDPLSTLGRIPLISLDKAWRDLHSALDHDRPAYQLVHVPDSKVEYLHWEGYFNVLEPHQVRAASNDLVTITDAELLANGVKPDSLDYVRFHIDNCLPQYKAIVDAEWGLITAIY